MGIYNWGLTLLWYVCVCACACFLVFLGEWFGGVLNLDAVVCGPLVVVLKKYVSCSCVCFVDGELNRDIEFHLFSRQAVGPVGRALEADFAAAPGAFAPIYTYSLSRGIYAGISLDGKVIVTRDRVNEKFYGRKVTGQQILDGEIPSPPAARPLYDALQRCHVYAKNDAGRSNGSGASFFQRPKTHVMNGYPEIPPTAMDPYSNFINHQQPSRTAGLDFCDPLMPPAPNDQHSYAGEMNAAQSCATGLSDITSDPGY